MTIEIDIELLAANGISADDYLALYAIYRKGFKTLDSLNLKPNWKDLEANGLIKLGATHEESVIRQKFINMFSSDFDQMFNDLLLRYPMKVRTSTGIRILHASDPKSKANKKARDKYKRVVGSKKFVHDRIMKLLDVQLRIDRDRLEYLQGLEVWINNHTWEKYVDVEENGEEAEQRTIRRL